MSRETLSNGKGQLRNLIGRYDSLFNNYVAHDLLVDNPGQISLLSTLLSASDRDSLVKAQEGLVKSAVRTWSAFREVQLQILADITLQNVDNQTIANLDRLQREPMFSDVQSAMVGLIRFNEKISQYVRNAVSVEERNQILTTVVGIVLAIVSIALIGLFISNTLVYRLKQIRRITKAVEQGEVKDRIRVMGSDEIADISASVNAMLEIIASEQEIKIASELKDQFIAGISHELRNPLTNLFGWLEILIDYHKELDEDTRMRFLGRAMYGCQEIMHIVNSVLDATRVGRGGIGTAQLKPVPLNPLVQLVLDNMNPHITENYRIKTVMEEEFVALADPQYLRQILQNLLTNAFKYSPKQSTVTVSIQRSSDQSTDNSSGETNNLLICVKDTGPGIPPEEIPNLFQKFARLRRDRSVHGTGLGLYLSKQLVESMGGSIWVESTGIAGEGSSFFFTLPQVSSVVDISHTPSVQGREIAV